MATIELRRSDDGIISYRAKVRLTGHPSQTQTFRRKTDATKWAHGVEAAMREGRHTNLTEAKRHTLKDLVDRYIKEVVPTRPKNAVNTERHLVYWAAKLGALALSDVTPARIVECRNDLLVEPARYGIQRSNATVVRYLAALSHAFTIAVKEWQWINENPVAKISKPREARGRERFLSDDERERLLAACRRSTNSYLYPVVVLAISTGMRRSEIMNLRWADVDFARRTIILTQTKNDTSRAVALTGHAFDLISKLAEVRRLDTNLIFYGTIRSKPMELRKPWDAAVKQAGLDDFRFHDLRHTFASYMAMNGATAVELAAVMGHKTLDMVKRYAHLTSSHSHNVVTAMNEKVFGVGKWPGSRVGSEAGGVIAQG